MHLTDWPDARELPADPDLVATMDLVRDVASAAKSVREARGLRRRLPLPSLTVALDGAERLEPFRSLLADEVNVKEVVLAEAGSLGTERYEVDLRAVGKRLGSDTPVVVKAMKAGDYRYDADADELVVGDGSQTTFRFGPGEYVRKLDADDPDSTAALGGSAGLVRLDCTVSEQLEAEGLVRDVARAVNELRRQEGLDVTDRIRLLVHVDDHDDVRGALEVFGELLTSSTLATELLFVDDRTTCGHRVELHDGRAIHVGLARP